MIRKFVYNNSKKETVILIHGLFTNSGFWLKYLFFLRNYRLVVYNIDYNTFLKIITKILIYIRSEIILKKILLRSFHIHLEQYWRICFLVRGIYYYLIFAQLLSGIGLIQLNLLTIYQIN